MRLILVLLFVAACLTPGAGQAQEIVVGGWVDRVDTAASTVTIRTLNGDRTVRVDPGAVIQVNGGTARLNQIPLDSRIWITAQKGPQGDLRATRLEVRAADGADPAAFPSGSVVTGRLVGIDVPQNRITVRTPAGDFPIALGSAPLLREGRAVTTRELRVGQQIRVVRSLPTAASTDYITQSIQILGPALAAAPVATPAVRMRSLSDMRTALVEDGEYPLVTVLFSQPAMVTRGLLVNGRAMMPARDLVDALGGMLHWEGGVRSVWAAFPARSQTMRLTAGSTATPVHTYAPHEADRSGGLLRVVRLDQPPLLVGGSLYVPISAVAEVAGASVRYDAENREVAVDTVFGGGALQR